MEMKIAGTCIICTGEIKDQGDIICLDCGKPCTVTPVDQEKINAATDGDMLSTNVKSDCCNSDVSLAGVRSTCSEACHEKLVERVEEQNGKFFEETDINGDIRIIPVRDILELGGLTEEKIMTYPKKEKEEHTHADGETCYACEHGVSAFMKHQEELMKKFGWVIHFVSPLPDDDRFNVHTHGILEKYGHPDLQIMASGLDPKISGKIIHQVVELIEAGRKFEAGKKYKQSEGIGVVKDFDVKFEMATDGDRQVLRLIFPSPINEFEGEFYNSQIKDLKLN